MFWHPSKVSFIAKSHLFLKDLDFIWCNQWCSKINKGQSFSALLISKSFQIIFIPYQTKLSVRKPQPLFFLCISDKYNQPREKQKWNEWFVRYFRWHFTWFVPIFQPNSAANSHKTTDITNTGPDLDQWAIYCCQWSS